MERINRTAKSTLKRFRHLAFCSLTLICFLALPVILPAQTQSTAVEIETLLQTDVVTYSQAARFVLEASEAMITSNPEEAFSYAVQQKWLPESVESSDPVRLDKLSLLLMRSFELRGGIFYSLFKNPHYAYRELVYINVIQGRHDPRMLVSGERLLFYVNRLFASQELTIAEERRRARQAAAERREREAAARRDALAAEIAVILEEQEMADTTVEATETGVTITLSNIQFLADSFELPQAERLKLQEIAVLLRGIPNIRLRIVGHTTRIGTDEYLLELSENRAREVANYLVYLGACSEDNISIVGYGADRPLMEGASPQALAANRRVEIIILED